MLKEKKHFLLKCVTLFRTAKRHIAPADLLWRDRRKDTGLGQIKFNLTALLPDTSPTPSSRRREMRNLRSLRPKIAINKLELFKPNCHSFNAYTEK